MSEDPATNRSSRLVGDDANDEPLALRQPTVNKHVCALLFVDLAALGFGGNPKRGINTVGTTVVGSGAVSFEQIQNEPASKPCTSTPCQYAGKVESP